MIDLYTAFKLTDIGETEIIHIRRKNQIFWSEYEHTSGREVVNKYDMRKVKVKEIRPLFRFGEYEGLLFTIKE